MSPDRASSARWIMVWSVDSLRNLSSVEWSFGAPAHRVRVTFVPLTLLGICVLSCRPTKAAESPAIELHLTREWSLGKADQPVAAVAQRNDLVAVIPGDRSRLILLESGGRTELRSSIVDRIWSVGADSKFFWIGAGSRLVSLDPTSREFLSRYDFGKSFAVAALAISEDIIWVVLSGNDGVSLVSLVVRGDGISRVRDIPLTTSMVYLAPWSGGAVFLQTMMHPFGYSIIDTLSMATGAMTIPTDLPEVNSSWVVNSAIPIDDDHFLQWRSHLHSIQRSGVIVQTVTGAVIRSSTFELPMSFLGVVAADESLVLASQERPDGRDLMLYRIGGSQN